MPRMNVQNLRNTITPSQSKRANMAFATIPLFPNSFPYNDMLFDKHLRVGKYAGVKTRSWNWSYRGPILFYNSTKTAPRAVQAWGYKNTPDRHRVIIGIGNLVDVRDLTVDEAKQMLANFNNKPLDEIGRMVRDLKKELGCDEEEIIYEFYVFGPYIAPFRNGLFFKNLKRFKTPVPFDWQPGPQKPQRIPLSLVSNTLKEIGIDPVKLLRTSSA